MIVFDLECRSGGHRFEGWFGSSNDFAQQQGRGLVICPVCSSTDVIKAVMAPNVGRKGNQLPSTPAAKPAEAETVTNSPVSLPPEAAAVLHAMAQAQAEALKASRWVGDKFADTARAIHYGERDAELVHGKTTPKEAQDLMEEGIEIAPVLFPIVPPGEAN
ncbi:MAG: hypothetical protein RLZZ136_1794 [Pseudomonadota bacterium]|jgi:hypothetical protein